MISLQCLITEFPGTSCFVVPAKGAAPIVAVVERRVSDKSYAVNPYAITHHNRKM